MKGKRETRERAGVREGVPASVRSQPIVIIQTHEEIAMAFGLNKVQIIGRLGADVARQQTSPRAAASPT